MIEFNSDGSIKLPDSMLKKKQDNEYRLRKGNCLLVKKEVISFTAPKKCMLHLRLSEALTDNRFVENIYRDAVKETPSKILKINEKEFGIEIGTHFKRCSDCSSLVNHYREFLGGNIIEEKGSCSYEGNSNFCFEDYFT